MRRTITTLLTVGMLALPVAQQASAAVTMTKKVVTKKFTGAAYQADRWGSLQVAITVRKTTTVTTGKKKVTRKITAVSVPTYPNHTDHSVFINSQALPILKSEALKAQSANINLVSGASDTSQAFAESLQSAILKAKRA
jgi:uncharacterized protein with FMN-binding domain